MPAAIAGVRLRAARGRRIVKPELPPEPPADFPPGLDLSGLAKCVVIARRVAHPRYMLLHGPKALDCTSTFIGEGAREVAIRDRPEAASSGWVSHSTLTL